MIEIIIIDINVKMDKNDGNYYENIETDFEAMIRDYQGEFTDLSVRATEADNDEDDNYN